MLWCGSLCLSLALGLALIADSGADAQVIDL